MHTKLKLFDKKIHFKTKVEEIAAIPEIKLVQEPLAKRVKFDSNIHTESIFNHL
jgi:hypothetical protein